MNKVRLSTTPDRAALAALSLGDVVYLDGTVYTAREGVYRRVVEDGEALPFDPAAVSATNFHCSPAATIEADGSYRVGAVTATASFRFSKWIGPWLDRSGATLILGKGGMNPEDYRNHFVRNGAVYLTTVGYGTGALLGRGIRRVKDVHWREKLGLAQAVWVIEVENFGPFLVESDLEGNSLFERENAKIAAGLDRVYEGTRPAVMKRFGETDDRRDEMI
ncbi:MAG: fumarate hydratase C-terminal domain-containing protein [Rhodospirillaceae bacterium]|nr:fumarate hydratase C-terminal domain-containing protein [Rhodospirillaceae bacterium]MDE0617005.1 fumarate hydratase C-terminal domain-containing protein [Rhodospirillaceae bacterium]